MLPDFTVVHKQDWFIAERYVPQITNDMSFLSRSYERHFNERPYLNHTCYLFITKTTRERTRQQSTFNTLCRGYLTPKEVRDKDAVGLFLDAVGQAESIINESGLFKVERLSEAEIVGTAEKAGILEKYFALTQDDTATLQDMQLDPGRMQVGMPAHALGFGRPAAKGFDGQPFRTALDGPKRLPPVVRGSCGPAAVVRPYL